MIWDRICSELGLSQIIESEIHPHHPLEHSELFHVRDGSGSTEFEFLNLLHAFVLALKPVRVLETGTFTGMGALAIASALQWNGRGQLTTIDIDECREARELAERYHELKHHIKFARADAEEYLDNYQGEPFEVAFIDSGDGRLREVLILIARQKLASGALVVVHDTSHLRVNANPSWGEIFEKDCPLKGHSIPLSRGIRIMWT